jgi:hypothetical protein
MTFEEAEAEAFEELIARLPLSEISNTDNDIVKRQKWIIYFGNELLVGPVQNWLLSYSHSCVHTRCVFFLFSYNSPFLEGLCFYFLEGKTTENFKERMISSSRKKHYTIFPTKKM